MKEYEVTDWIFCNLSPKASEVFYTDNIREKIILVNFTVQIQSSVMKKKKKKETYILN